MVTLDMQSFFLRVGFKLTDFSGFGARVFFEMYQFETLCHRNRFPSPATKTIESLYTPIYIFIRPVFQIYVDINRVEILQEPITWLSETIIMNCHTNLLFKSRYILCSKNLRPIPKTVNYHRVDGGPLSSGPYEPMTLIKRFY